MAENRRGKENRFYFSRGQMVLLGGAFVLAAAVIFILGMFVGKGIEERKIAKQEQPLVKIPVKPEDVAAGAGVAQKKDEITFNDGVTKPSPDPAILTVPEKAKTEKPAEKIARSEPVPSKTEKQAAKKAPEAAPKKTAAEPTEGGNEGEKIWRAQVNAYPDERSAKLLVDRLKNKGYKAYVSEVENRGRTWYRVSVGPFNNRDEADKMVETLRSKENHPKAFAASK